MYYSFSYIHIYLRFVNSGAMAEWSKALCLGLINVKPITAVFTGVSSNLTRINKLFKFIFL